MKSRLKLEKVPDIARYDFVVVVDEHYGYRGVAGGGEIHNFKNVDLYIFRHMHRFLKGYLPENMFVIINNVSA